MQPLSPMIAATAKPSLSPKARLRVDRRTGRYLLLYPERGLDLNGTAGEITRLCTGAHRMEDIVRHLTHTYPEVSPADIERSVSEFLRALAARGLLQDHR